MYDRAGQLKALTGLRGVAAFVIVLFHAKAAIDSNLGDIPWLDHGYLAVDIFFVLSGFVMFWTYRDHITSRSRLVEFYAKRIARIYPLHVLLLVPFAILALGPALLKGNIGEFIYLKSYLLGSLLLIQNWGFWPKLALNIPAWSISTEFFCYLIFPGLALIAARLRVGPVRASLLILALAILLYAYFAVRSLAYAAHIAETGLFRCVMGFACGIICARLFVEQTGCDRSATTASLWRTLALLVAGCVAGAVLDMWLVPAAAVSLLLVCLLWTRFNPLASRPLIWLGDISYSVYMTHYLLFLLIKMAFGAAGGDLPAEALALYILATLGLSALLYRFVERPAQRATRNWLMCRFTRGPAPTIQPAVDR